MFCAGCHVACARGPRQCHHSTTAKPISDATISVTSKAEFSIQAMAGTPSAMITPSKQTCQDKHLHAGREGAEREQGKDRQRRRLRREDPLHARQQQDVHHQQERAPMQRLRHDQTQAPGLVAGLLPARTDADETDDRREDLPVTGNRRFGEGRVGDAGNRQDQHDGERQFPEPDAPMLRGRSSRRCRDLGHARWSRLAALARSSPLLRALPQCLRLADITFVGASWRVGGAKARTARCAHPQRTSARPLPRPRAASPIAGAQLPRKPDAIPIHAKP